MVFNSAPSLPSKRKPDHATLSPPHKRVAATRTHNDIYVPVQDEQLCTDIAPVKVDPIVSVFDNLSLSPGLLRLPNEVLDNVASFLVPSTIIHIVEGMSMSIVQQSTRRVFQSSPSPVSKQHKLELSNLRHLALVCRRFRPVVEGQLYRDISIPHREPRACGGIIQDPNISLLCLARTLFDRPDLTARVKSLKVWVQDRSLLQGKSNPYYPVFERAHVLLEKMQLSFDEIMTWTTELHEFQELALHAIVISLLPRLETVEMNGPICCPKLYRRLYTPPGAAPRNSHRAVPYLGVAFHQSTALATIHLNMPFRIPNLPTSNLTTLTLDIVFFGDHMNLLNRPRILPSVHTLTVTLNLYLVNKLDFNIAFPELHPEDGLRVFVRDIIPNLSRFAIDSPGGTIPYLNGQVDKRGNKLSVLSLEGHQDIEYNPLHHRHHGAGAFDWLLNVLYPARNRILQLSLPSNWYSSNGHYVKAIPTLQQLKRLVVLHIPHVALVSNRHGWNFDPELHWTPATQFFPTSLEILTITQVNMETCAWLQGAFAEHHLLPRLRCVYLYFREDYWARVPKGFQHAARVAGVRVVAYWKGKARVL